MAEPALCEGWSHGFDNALDPAKRRLGGQAIDVLGLIIAGIR
jgi:hypothetical protein